MTKMEECHKIMMLIKMASCGRSGVERSTSMYRRAGSYSEIVAGKMTQETKAGKMDDAAEDGGGSISVGSAR